MQRQFNFNEELFIPGGADFLDTVFIEYLNPPSRGALALTSQCHAAFFRAVIDRAVHSDLRRELMAMGFKFDVALDLTDVDIEFAREFISILQANHALISEKIQFIAYLASDKLQSSMSISSWRVAIFCLLTILGLDLNKPEIGHNFVTDANLAVFKNLAVKLHLKSTDSTRNENFTQLIPAINDCCQALTLAGEVALSRAFEVFKYEVYLPSELIEGTTLTYADQLLKDFIRDIQASTHKLTDAEFTAHTPTDLYRTLSGFFGFDFLLKLRQCYCVDKRSARWIIGMLNGISEEDLDNLKRFRDKDTLDRLICNAKIIDRCFPVITPALFEEEYYIAHPDTAISSTSLNDYRKCDSIELAKGAKHALVSHVSADITDSAKITKIVRLFEKKEFIRAIVRISRMCCYVYISGNKFLYLKYVPFIAELVNLFLCWRPSDFNNVEAAVLVTMANIADVMYRKDYEVDTVFTQWHRQIRASAFIPRSFVWKLPSDTRNAMMSFRLRLSDSVTRPPQEPYGSWFDSALFYHLSLDQSAVQRVADLGSPAVLLSRCASYTVDNQAVSYLNILLKMPDAVYTEVLTVLQLEFENYKTRVSEYSNQGCARYLVSKLHGIYVFNLFFDLFKERGIYYNLCLHPAFFAQLFEHDSLVNIMKIDSIKLTHYRSFVDTRRGSASLLSVIMDVFNLVSRVPASSPGFINVHEAMQINNHIVLHAHHKSLVAFINRHRDNISFVENRAMLVDAIAPKPDQDQAGPKRAPADMDDSDAPKKKKAKR